MKILIIVFLLCGLSYHSLTQTKYPEVTPNVEDCNCPEPETVNYARLCSYSKDKARGSEKFQEIGDYLFAFEEELLKMSCVDLTKDSRETIIRKVNCMWNKAKKKCKCDSLNFNVPNGNILKFAMNFNFPDFIYLLGDNYNVDFMFVDPADGKTIIQYLDEEIVKTNKYGPEKLKEMMEIREYILQKRVYNPKTELFEVVD